MTAERASAPVHLATVLLCGIAGGLVASVSCCLWLGVLVAGLVAARRALVTSSEPERVRRGRVGALVGLVAGSIAATAGTAVVLWQTRPANMSPSDRALLESFFGGSVPEVPMAGLAFGNAFFAFTTCLLLGWIGGLLARGPAPSAPVASSFSEPGGAGAQRGPALPSSPETDESAASRGTAPSAVVQREVTAQQGLLREEEVLESNDPWAGEAEGEREQDVVEDEPEQ